MSDPDLAILFREIDMARTPQNGITLPPELHAEAARMAGELYFACHPAATRFDCIEAGEVAVLDPLNPHVAESSILRLDRVTRHTQTRGNLRLFEGWIEPYNRDGIASVCYGSVAPDGHYLVIAELPSYQRVRAWLHQA